MKPEQIAELSKPLDPKHVRTPSGQFGPKGDYLEGWHVINELNRVFGFDGWSYNIDLNRDDLREGKDGNGKPQWQAAYTCICTLTTSGIVRQDVGFGSGFARGIGDAIEGATKEAATDALKRCARTFGNIFGLALYDKRRGNVGVANISDAQIAELQTMIQNAGINTLDFLTAGKVEKIPDLSAADFERAKRWITTSIEKQKGNA